MLTEAKKLSESRLWSKEEGRGLCSCGCTYDRKFWLHAFCWTRTTCFGDFPSHRSILISYMIIFLWDLVIHFIIISLNFLIYQQMYLKPSSCKISFGCKAFHLWSYPHFSCTIYKNQRNSYISGNGRASPGSTSESSLNRLVCLNSCQASSFCLTRAHQISLFSDPFYSQHKI